MPMARRPGRDRRAGFSHERAIRISTGEQDLTGMSTMTGMLSRPRHWHRRAGTAAAASTACRTGPFAAFNFSAIPAPDGPETDADIGDRI